MLDGSSVTGHKKTRNVIFWSVNNNSFHLRSYTCTTLEQLIQKRGVIELKGMTGCIVENSPKSVFISASSAAREVKGITE